MLNPDYETSLRYGLDAVSLAPALELFRSGKSHIPGLNCRRFTAEPQDFPGMAVESDVADFVLAVTN
jgi:hypothetical protein